jgi:hypothetical protein
VPAMPDTTTCKTCRQEYDPQDAEQVKRHTESIGCSCGRCNGRPGCYMCTGSFCFCHAH